MKGKKVVSYKNMPARWPIGPAILLWLLLDRLSAPEWVWGVVVTLLALWAVGVVVETCTQQQVNLFKEDSK